MTTDQMTDDLTTVAMMADMDVEESACCGFHVDVGNKKAKLPVRIIHYPGDKYEYRHPRTGSVTYASKPETVVRAVFTAIQIEEDRKREAKEKKARDKRNLAKLEKDLSEISKVARVKIDRHYLEAEVKVSKRLSFNVWMDDDGSVEVNIDDGNLNLHDATRIAKALTTSKEDK